MKKNIQKIIAALMITIFIGISDSYAGETYAKNGAIVGGILGAIPGAIFGIQLGGLAYSESNESAPIARTIGFTLGGAVAGALVFGGVFALVGSTIPKKQKFTVTPTFDPTPGAAGGGVNFSMNF